MRARAIPMYLVDFSLIAGLSAGGMMLVFALMLISSQLTSTDFLFS